MASGPLSTGCIYLNCSLNATRHISRNCLAGEENETRFILNAWDSWDLLIKAAGLHMGKPLKKETRTPRLPWNTLASGPLRNNFTSAFPASPFSLSLSSFSVVTPSRRIEDNKYAGFFPLSEPIFRTCDQMIPSRSVIRIHYGPKEFSRPDHRAG